VKEQSPIRQPPPCSCPQAAKQMLNHGESPRNDHVDISEVAAYTAVAGIILNLDETITKE
jgi:hypothetical protein